MDQGQKTPTLRLSNESRRHETLGRTFGCGFGGRVRRRQPCGSHRQRNRDAVFLRTDQPGVSVFRPPGAKCAAVRVYPDGCEPVAVRGRSAQGGAVFQRPAARAGHKDVENGGKRRVLGPLSRLCLPLGRVVPGLLGQVQKRADRRFEVARLVRMEPVTRVRDFGKARPWEQCADLGPVVGRDIVRIRAGQEQCRFAEAA